MLGIIDVRKEAIRSQFNQEAAFSMLTELEEQMPKIKRVCLEHKSRVTI